MDQFTTYGAVVGRSPCLHWLRPLLVDHPPHHVLQQCMCLLLPLPSVSESRFLALEPRSPANG